jgi:DNA processing protein
VSALEPWLVLRTVKGLSDGTLTRLVREFGSPHAVSSAPLQELQDRGNISRNLATAIRQGPNPQARTKAEHEARRLETEDQTVLTILDPSYPQKLSQIADPPPLLYLSGALEPSDDRAIAIVGARKASPAGLVFTEELSHTLADLGFTIVSGMARGVDAAAHRGALKAHGRTIAVLGCGIDHTYPPEHRKLREAIETRGAVISEFSLGTQPRPYNFPRRNRIISGLSYGVVVTQATQKSGSLITARYALEHNREVFAVPGNVKEGKHEGPHRLIKEGAKLVENVGDIIEELFPQLDESFQDQVKRAASEPRPSAPDLSTQEKEIFNLVTDMPTSVDEVLAQAHYLPAEVLGILLALELKGIIQQVPGSCYRRR